MEDHRLWNLFLKGKAEEVKEYLEENPSFDINSNNPDSDFGPLHVACIGGNANAVELLVAHPQINVNQKNDYGASPFLLGCVNGKVEIVKVLLKDSRVDINMADNHGCTPWWWTSFWGRVEVIQWMIASGRDIDLDMKGRYYDDTVFTAIEIAREENKTEVVSLLERFVENQTQTRHEIRVELGLVDTISAELFSMTVFLCDDYLTIKEHDSKIEVVRFFKIIGRLPMELQMVLCCRVYGLSKEYILSKDSGPAFRSLASKFLLE